jgi:hypothetical protein
VRRAKRRNAQTRWRCEACGAAGWAEHGEAAAAAEILARIRRVHGARSPSCTAGVSRMRFGPEPRPNRTAGQRASRPPGGAP